jgi:hypothetical protein
MCQPSVDMTVLSQHERCCPTNYLGYKNYLKIQRGVSDNAYAASAPSQTALLQLKDSSGANETKPSSNP